MIKEFRNFINRGNVVELGVAFVMGASFKSLVDVFTKKLTEPLIGLIINLPNLDNLGLFGDVLLCIDKQSQFLLMVISGSSVSEFKIVDLVSICHIGRTYWPKVSL